MFGRQNCLSISKARRTSAAWADTSRPTARCRLQTRTSIPKAQRYLAIWGPHARPADEPQKPSMQGHDKQSLPFRGPDGPIPCGILRAASQHEAQRSLGVASHGFPGAVREKVSLASAAF